MWVEELKNGKYKFCERYTDELTGKKKKVSITLEKNTASSRKIALEELNEKILSANQCSNIDNITLERAISYYLSYQAKTVKLSTYSRNMRSLDTITRILGKDTLLNSLTSSYINKRFLDEVKELGTINEYFKRLKALLNWCFQNDLLKDYNIIKKLVSFKEEKSHREKIIDKYLEPYEIDKLLSDELLVNYPYWDMFTRFLLLSGLRIGEAIALTTDDIDIKKRIIRVNKTYDTVNKIVTSTKTTCSDRETFMQDELLDLCKRILMINKELKFQHRISNNCFLIQGNFKMVRYNSYRQFLNDVSERALGRRITPHALRHTHASLLLAEDTDVDTISRRLGHRDSQITKDIYLHVTEKLVDKDNQSISNIKIL